MVSRCTRLLLAGIASLLIALATPASARASPAAGGLSAEADRDGTATAAPRRVVVYTEGYPVKNMSADDLREDLLLLLPDDVAVEDNAKFRKALRHNGAGPVLGNHIAVAFMRNNLLRIVRRAMKEVNADGAIIARLRRDRQLKPEAYLLYVLRDSEELLVAEAVPLAVDDEVARLAALEHTLSKALERIAPSADLRAPQPQPTPEEPPPRSSPHPKAGASETPPDKPPAEAGMALLAAEAGYRLGGRRFQYSAPGTANLRPFGAFGFHMLALGAQAYPFAGIAVAQHLGFVGSYSRAFGLRAVLPDGRKASTTHDNLRAGLGVRFRTGDPPAPVVTVNGGFGWWRYRFSGQDNPIFDQLPDVWYAYASAGFDVRVPVGPVGFHVGADYLGPFQAG